MPTTITVRDELSSGGAAGELTLEFLTERITVRELIRSRVYQEVTEFNASQAWPAPPLVQPTADERLLNGEPRSRRRRKIDWERQYERAVQAFQRSQVLILVDDQQREDLEEEIELRPETRITFLRLVPLAGG
jgi:hypothetical protein